MNKDNVRKYMADIQIAMGKILEEMEGFSSVATKLKNHNNLDEGTAQLTEDLGIAVEEASTITDILNNTTPRVIEENPDDVGLTQPQIDERNAYKEMGVEWPDPRKEEPSAVS